MTVPARVNGRALHHSQQANHVAPRHGSPSLLEGRNVIPLACTLCLVTACLKAATGSSLKDSAFTAAVIVAIGIIAHEILIDGPRQPATLRDPLATPPRAPSPLLPRYTS